MKRRVSVNLAITIQNPPYSDLAPCTTKMFFFNWNCAILMSRLGWKQGGPAVSTSPVPLGRVREAQRQRGRWLRADQKEGPTIKARAAPAASSTSSTWLLTA